MDFARKLITLCLKKKTVNDICNNISSFVLLYRDENRVALRFKGPTHDPTIYVAKDYCANPSSSYT